MPNTATGRVVEARIRAQAERAGTAEAVEIDTLVADKGEALAEVDGARLALVAKGSVGLYPTYPTCQQLHLVPGLCQLALHPQVLHLHL